MDENIIKNQIESLPSNIKKAMLSVGFNENLTEISSKYNLDFDKSTELFLETYIIFLGIEGGELFVSNIEKSVGVSKDVAFSIAKEINGQIFIPLKKALESPSGEISINKALVAQEENSREQILNEIENPVSGDRTENQESRIKNRENPLPPNLPTGTPPSRDQIIGRLTNNLKPPTITIPEKNPSPSPQPSQNASTGFTGPLPKQQATVPRYTGGSNDPYREAIE